MTSFEKIVRPFLSTDITPQQKLLATVRLDIANILIEAGKVGETKLFNENASFTTTYYLPIQHREKKRTTTTKTITDPGSGAELDVEYIDSLRARSNNGQEIVSKYKRQP